MKKGRLIVAASSDSADMRYASGFNAPDPFVYLAVDDDKRLVVSKMEFARARSEAKDDLEVVDGDQLVDGDVTAGRTRRILLAALANFKGIVWEVPRTFPLALAEFLRENGIDLLCVDGEFFPERRRKSDAEIDHIVESLRAAERGMSRAIDVLRRSTIDKKGFPRWRGRSLTSETLRREMEVEILRAGATALDTIVACGAQAAEPHNVGEGPLRVNAPIVIDVFPRIARHGYWGDLTRTFVKGTASELVRSAYAAVKEAKEGAKRLVRAGIPASKVHAYAADSMRKRGFETETRDGVHVGFIHGLGHGVGLEIHEAPRVSSSSDEPLEEGSVITVEPGLYDPEWGGVRLEDMAVVRATSCETLTVIDEFLEIV